MKREHLWNHHEQDAALNWKLCEGGYADRMSVRAGETLSLHISNSRSYFEVFIFREGAERRLMHVLTGLTGALHPVPPTGYRDGFDWPATVTWRVPADWPSGVYLATFATGQGLREILFVVRPPSPRAPLLVTIAANTYQAYNNVGGKCLYDYISTDRTHSDRLSFDRPFQADCLGNFYLWDQFFISWLETAGYAVDYCVNGDHDAEPELLSAYRANLRLGHDEYNSRAECEQLQAFVRAGGHLLVFGGNCFYWEVELQQQQRQLVCAKPHTHAPPPPGQPMPANFKYLDDLRQRTVGVYYTAFVHAKTPDPQVFLAPTTGEYGFYRVTAPEHWFYAGTGLAVGDEFGRADLIAGVEVDGADLMFVDGRPRFTGRDGVSPHYQVLALADALIDDAAHLLPGGAPSGGPAPAYGVIAINETEFKGTIFHAATIEWGHGLYREDGVVSQLTRNVLDRLAR